MVQLALDFTHISLNMTDHENEHENEHDGEKLTIINHH